MRGGLAAWREPGFRCAHPGYGLARGHEHARYDATFVLTRSEKGSVIVSKKEKVVLPARRIDRLVDATGAGDAYTAGFLHAWTSGSSLRESADLGTACAATVIQQVGARLEKGFRP